MEKIIVRGGRQLSGSVKVEGAKNAVLPVIAASILASRGTSKIYDVPKLADVYTMKEVLRNLNINVEYENGEFVVNATNPLKTEAPFEYVRKMRASFLVMGPLLARVGHARIALPGGCAIGSRPIDQHLKGFEAMGATVEIGNGFIEAKVEGRLQGTKIYLDFPSVGATENIMMAAAMAEGTTILENAAEEPEIVCLANYLNAMGAKVRGAGTGVIRIEGVDELVGAEHTVISDRIEAGTFMVAAAITGGDVFIEGAVAEHLRPLIAKMHEMGVKTIEEDNGIRVIGPDELKPVDIKTMPHPGFPTDMQSQMMALLLRANGTSVITETVFENRFMHVEEFRRMNGNIKIEGRSAIISGPCQLQGAEVTATDLRAGAALVLAGLVADGHTRVVELKHVDRGYVDLAGKLARLGADIERVVETEHELENLDAPAPLKLNTNLV
ncbi:UDP-N-acetylglucosamine 1-carboxyvinyltransferase [Halalkalibacterium halodurans]|uniref:UDP-N-acetylglucosamine 1-carboxyvinyltransferase 1 n=1 Tax=Halalkalibacterium halodurans (strain ATCC BAA-125 / DSM 18197 / FERM 7344 / JCM 9153 / C-125) TaxID=272558 RepID=MURA1_HALH5|nr:UDP-N-acetylglucosamine 1-carboxyvinyltransferase [Halalkalibacterium halodurans]Q9K6I0.1 RecName: Full=UDP-N-acetylglucosamine 1-carboxyvinyltransferase 1; AltName: Full=Enoylpyruvate transferase 1; AltName: Full=UDP-N-acetylglucosamine enolpyruvyl transferase 1; Short=EPT 1 [Halalkalibacterium halodurans C-125]MED4174794.1 UDP-N-acetylglucosamine 1-carboxyvinyltransferase [Halalkalibacterium halodurans]BAB07468.1 UDP-N-acetylglucosamine 1-carboxyvinyltransferase [Halalkalibacterium halodura